MLSSLHDRLLEKYARLIGALCDPARRMRTMFWLALAYAACWALYATIAKSSQGINADMAEMVVWGRNPDWGYPKHPPLLGWVLGAWFAVFPLADWAFHVLAAITLAAGLWLSFLLAGLWLDGEKRAVAPFLLALIPFYNFIGLKFDQNSALIPLWALTTWAFVRSLRTNCGVSAAIAGAGAAAAMLTKYWSAFLILALIVAALTHANRKQYFRSIAPWITTGVGAVLIAPHVVWLIANDFPPLKWVGTRRTSQSLLDALRSLSEYSLGTLGYCALALIVYVIYVRPSRAALRDTLAPPADPMRCTVGIVFWTPLLLPVLMAFALKTNLLSLWNTPALGLLPAVLMSSPLVTVTRDAAARIAATSVTVSLLALLASPIVAGVTLRAGVENHAAYAREAATRVETEWQATSGQPLAVLAGPFALASTTAFYLKDRPSTYADFSSYLSPWLDDRALADRSLAILCPASDAECLRQLEAFRARRTNGRRAETTIVPQWLWLRGAPETFVIATFPPR
jgi:4-amino-4-deoxy-L-arabinose transferase-like glycosyltransferase